MPCQAENIYEKFQSTQEAVFSSYKLHRCNWKFLPVALCIIETRKAELDKSNIPKQSPGECPDTPVFT